ncbi:hypothetical protein KAR26_02885 [Candidatus Parcubacteria bacterium]|nr:hypothetical protein [Candidatus Parcubacteria bacterium]
MRKLLIIPIFLCLIFSSFSAVLAQDIRVDFFYSNTCPHCADESEFLEEMEEKYPQIEVARMGVWEQENLDLLEKLYNQHEVPQEVRGFVPVTFINEYYFFGNTENQNKEIENSIRTGLGLPALETEEANNKIKIPFIGEVDIGGFSPLALAVVLGALDGFNACAMVALGFLLAVLVATGIRKRVFLIGSVFILVSGMVYFLFISAWLNLFLVLENIKIITILVGFAVTLFAGFLLKDYFSGVVCKLCHVKPGKQGFFSRIEQKLFLKMQKLTTAEMSLPITLLGVAVVAAGINMVELVCSFGFPLVFTKILTSWELSTLSYYSYLLVYILFYMLDDFVIFLIAVWTLRITQASEKYLKAIKLISGILLLLLGLIILIKPELLMFK